MKIKNWLKKFLSGAAMGVATSIPGVSGGTIAVITGVFETIIGAINNLFKHFFKSLLTLLPIGIGMICAVIPCFLFFEKAFESFVFGLVTIFAGLVIGSFPGIVREVKDEPIKPKYIVVAVISGLIAIGLGVSSVLMKDTFDVGTLIKNPTWWFYLILIPVGFLASFSLIVPGISGSMLLLVLGFYNPLVEAINTILKLDFTHGIQIITVLGTFAVGLIVGFFVVSKFMGFLLNKHHTISFYSIIGFIIGSTIILYFNKDVFQYYLVWAGQSIEEISPWLPWYIEVPVGVILGTAAAFGSYQIVKRSNKPKEEFPQA